MTIDYPPVDRTAHCVQPDVDPAQFHPESAANGHTLKATKAICTGKEGKPACPFLEPCLAWALQHNVQGIWGGVTESERRTLRERAGIRATPPTFADLPRCGLGWYSDAPHGTPGAIGAHYRRGEKMCDRCRAAESDRRKKRAS